MKILENVRKECKRLGVFGDYWSPFTMPIQSEDIRIFVALSERRFGKTTNCLLPMIVDYWLNGVRPLDIFPSRDKEGRPILVAVFKRSETKEVFDLWVKHELK